MRWFERPAKRSPKVGDLRSRSGYLFFPKKIQGQWRWLEQASWTERYSLDWVSSFSGTHYYKWKSIAWVERLHDS